MKNIELIGGIKMLIFLEKFKIKDVILHSISNVKVNKIENCPDKIFANIILGMVECGEKVIVICDGICI